jgi:hypothetical protein
VSGFSAFVQHIVQAGALVKRDLFVGNLCILCQRASKENAQTAVMFGISPASNDCSCISPYLSDLAKKMREQH